jgi:hemolysin D
VDTYDFQKYGMIKGSVDMISPFILEDKENLQSQMANEAGATGNYPVFVKMLSEELKIKNGDVFKVKPGMSVTAEINVGRRRIIEFFLFPVIKYLDEGLNVR